MLMASPQRRNLGELRAEKMGSSDTAELETPITTTEDMMGFVDAVVDIIAPSFGNIHGEYGARGIQLDWERLENVRSIAAKNDVGIVFPGVNDFGTELMRQVISRGVTKVNLDKDVLGYYRYVEEDMGRVPFTTLMENGVEEVRKGLEICMNMCTSTGKASSHNL